MSPQDDEDYLTGRTRNRDEDGPYRDRSDARGPMQPHRGTLVLVMGILGFLVCFICGIFAWVWGNEDVRKMKAGEMDPEGRGLTDAGRVMGIISVVLALLGLIIFGLVMCVGLGTAAYQSGM